MKPSPTNVFPIEIGNVLACISDAFVALDNNGYFTYINKKAGEIFNQDPKEMIGQNIWTEFPEEVGMPFYKAYNQAVAKQRYMELEEYYPHDHKWFEIQICPSLQGVFIFFRDITLRKKAENGIKKSEIKYRRLFESAKDGILILDAKTGKIVDANPFIFVLLGYSQIELFGKELWEIGVFKDISLSKEAFIELQKKKYIYYDDLPLESKNGKVTAVEFVSNVYTAGDKKVIQCNIRVITERINAAAEIKSANEQLRQLTAHLQNILEEERKRIGREIHDDLGQQLTAIKMDVVWIDKKTAEDLKTIKSKLKNIITLLDNSNLAVRNILNELRPAVLDNYNLIEAIEWQGIQFTENTGIPLSFSSDVKEFKLEQQVSISLFRIFQEALTNIKKYAFANKVTVVIKYTDDLLILKIKDNGKGFNVDILKTQNSFGILGMKERVIVAEGTFEIISSPGKGTKLTITIPHKQ